MRYNTLPSVSSGIAGWSPPYCIAPDAPQSLLLLRGLSIHNARNKIYQRTGFEYHTEDSILSFNNPVSKGDITLESQKPCYPADIYLKQG